MLHELRRNGLEIDRICHIFRGLNRCDIRVNEHRLDAFFFQSLECLCSAVIKLTSLSDLESARAKKEDLLYG